MAAFPWADRLRLPSLRPSPASQCRWRPDALTDRRESLCLGPTVMTGASWGCLYPANLEARRPRLALMAQDQDRTGAGGVAAGGWPTGVGVGRGSVGWGGATCGSALGFPGRPVPRGTVGAGGAKGATFGSSPGFPMRPAGTTVGVSGARVGSSPGFPVSRDVIVCIPGGSVESCVAGSVGGRRRHPRLATQAHRKSVDGGDILTMFSLDNGLYSAVRDLICFCSRLFDRLNFVLTRRDIGCDGVLGAHDVGRCVVAPTDGSPKLTLVLLHGISGGINCSTSCLRGVT